MTNPNQKGFTLVELSIVLVIIGLLIGGILAAQSMIGTAKIQATVRQVGQFDAVVMNFRDKFGGLPGDVNAVGDAVTTGDGDGIIESVIAATSDTTNNVTFAAEPGSFWNALSLTGLSTEGQGTGGTKFVQAVSTATTLSVSGTTANIPKAKAGSSTSGFVPLGTVAGANYYVLLSTTDYASSAYVASTATNGAVTPADALALDTKMDNGVANSGYVVSGATATTGPTISGVSSATLCNTTTAYNVTVTTTACLPAIRMGASAGNPA